MTDDTPGREGPFDEPDEGYDAALTSVVRQLGAEARAGRPAHPDPEALIEYSQGDIDAEAAERIRAHLEICSDCARTVLDLGELARFETAPEDPSPEEIAVRFRGFEEELARRAAKPSVSAEVVPLEERASPARRRWMMPAAWAAALLAAFFLLLVFNRGAGAPRPNVHVASLAPAAQSLARGAADAFGTLRVPASSERFVLILNLTDSRPFARYRLAIARATEDGEAVEEVWRGEDLQRATTGNFTVEFERRFLAPGRYVFELSGLGDGEPASLARYAVELVYE